MKKIITVTFILFAISATNTFAQTMKILTMFGFDSIHEEEIKSGITINETRQKGIELVEVADKSFIPIPNVRVFGIKGYTDSSDIIYTFYKRNWIYSVLLRKQGLERKKLPNKYLRIYKSVF